MELNGWIAFVAIGAILGFRWRRNKRPDTAALLFVSCFTMWWQEFYADWGAYLYYNPSLIQLPWGPTALTTPIKPLYVLAGYGWFYAGAFGLIHAVFMRFRSRYPHVPVSAAILLTAVIPFFAWNLITADGISFLTNWYQYLHPLGPSIQTSKGGLPLMYPAFPFVMFAPAVVWSLYRRDDFGRTWFEGLLGVPAMVRSWRQRLHQVLAWCLAMNVLYALTLTVPLVTVRILFLPDNQWVPTGRAPVEFGVVLAAIWVVALAGLAIYLGRWRRGAPALSGTAMGPAAAEVGS
ncbi:hypothetical protein A5713_12780 [Mycobacterium sp. E2497]|nr:hypothetical protein A5713_12780 [Mycobacterium sp. E2497]